MAETQNSVAAGVTESTTTPSAEQNPNPIVTFLFNLLNNFKFNLPPLPFLPPPKHVVIEESSSSAAVPLLPEETSVGQYEKESSSRSVSYPRHNFSPLKLPADDVEARETNPGTIWMAYAFGGYLVASWAWTRWNERRSRSNPSNDRPPPNSD